MSEESTIATVTTVRMKPYTIAQVEKLRETVKAASFSDMIRRSVDISDMIIDAISSGKKVIIEDKKGKQQQILVSGLNGVFK